MLFRYVCYHLDMHGSRINSVQFSFTEGKSDLDGQIKILEEKNTTLIQTNMELEEVF